MKYRAAIDETAVILCGGKGRRFGIAGERLPKVLALVHGKPILWYNMLRLHQDGFRHFVLPLGYLGDEIRKFVEGALRNLDARIEMIETGDETPVGRRLSLVRHAIGSDDFLLVNGDTLFDFDLADLMAAHRSGGAELTLTSCRLVSQYGLLLIDEAGRVVDFVRDATVTGFVVDGHDRRGGLINAGIAALDRRILDIPGIDTAPEFEQYLYLRIIGGGGARHYAINGYWHAIDTQKDLDIANSSSEDDPRARGSRLLAAKLSAYALELRIVR